MSRTPPEGKRFQPGESGNPLGAALHNPVIKAIRRMTQDEVADIGQLILDSNVEALTALRNDRSASVLKVWIAAVAITAIKKGDAQALNAILDRIVGKLKENIDAKSEVRIIIEDYQRKLTSDGT